MKQAVAEKIEKLKKQGQTVSAIAASVSSPAAVVQQVAKPAEVLPVREVPKPVTEIPGVTERSGTTEV